MRFRGRGDDGGRTRSRGFRDWNGDLSHSTRNQPWRRLGRARKNALEEPRQNEKLERSNWQRSEAVVRALRPCRDQGCACREMPGQDRATEVDCSLSKLDGIRYQKRILVSSKCYQKMTPTGTLQPDTDQEDPGQGL